MVKKTELLVCLLLTTFMVTVKGNTNSTSENKTSNGASINYPSTLIPLNASTIGKAIFPKLEIKRERDVAQGEGGAEETSPAAAEDENKSSENLPDESDDNEREDKPGNETNSSEAPAASSSVATSLPSNSTGSASEETESVESSVGTGSDHTDDTTSGETEETSPTKDPGAKEGSAVCFKPALVYFLLLPLCITTKVRLLW